jgi:alcohol dehydrogenase/propanol-preferring alcohol dehydrogenase
VWPSTDGVVDEEVNMAARMKAVVVSKQQGPWELQDRERPEVGPGQVLVRIHACASVAPICGSLTAR